MIRIQVQNINHDVIRTIDDDETESLRSLSDLGAIMRTSLGAIDPHGDGMLNSSQLRWLVEELGKLLTTDILGLERAAMCAELLEAANEAIRNRGYLFFVGD